MSPPPVPHTGPKCDRLQVGVAWDSAGARRLCCAFDRVATKCGEDAREKVTTIEVPRWITLNESSMES